MNNEIEQKKEYVAPLMEVYSFRAQRNLLDCSPMPCPEPPPPESFSIGIEW